MTHRILIVTGSYAPTMTADMHRARHLAWELPKLGWDVEILCPDQSYQRSQSVDADSEPFFSPTSTIHFVTAYRPAFFSALGLGGIGLRAFVPMMRAGRELLKSRRFDLVYFSTAQYPLFMLGPVWWRKFGIPYVLDFHDPWYVEGKTYPSWARRSVKHAIALWLGRHMESLSAIYATGIVSVSPHYSDMLYQRYAARKPAWLGTGRMVVIPFAALPHDLDAASRCAGHCRGKQTQQSKIVYVGAGGPIMRRSFALLCRTLSHLRAQHPKLVEGVKIYLYGTMTGWREGDPQDLANIAHDQGVADLVKEHPRWISYGRSLDLLLESDGALILGVDDAGYMPSKLFSYALTGKPLLALLRADGPAFTQFQSMKGLGHVLWFNESDEMPLADAAIIVKHYLEEVVARQNFDRRAILEPFLAASMAHRHVSLFEACLQN
jgi:hypothetical protein